MTELVGNVQAMLCLEGSTALRTLFGTVLAVVWAKGRGNVVASRLHQPPVSMAGPTTLHRLERRSSAYVRSVNLRASWSICVLAGASAGLAG